LRDAFLRVAEKTVLISYEVRCAEEMEWAFPRGGAYGELIEFESDFAPIMERKKFQLFRRISEKESSPSIYQLWRLISSKTIYRRSDE
jgi:hypothetical protein